MLMASDRTESVDFVNDFEDAGAVASQKPTSPSSTPSPPLPAESDTAALAQQNIHNMAETKAQRPESSRSSTDPLPAALLQGYFATPKHQSNPPRNRSPFSRSHLRSRSSGAALGAPVMVRAHSMPAVHSLSRSYDLSAPSGPSSGSLSPQRSPARVRSPLSSETQDYTFPAPRSPRWFEATGGAPIESIQEDSELELTPRNSSAYTMPAPPSAALTRSGSARRRPTSPLYSITSSSTSIFDANAASASNSPSLTPTRYNEGFPSQPSLHHYASSSSFSSISTTPSSARSRSPSISSLETIEDAPDAESEAIEAERIMRLKLAAEREERAERGEDTTDEGGRRKSLDGPRGFGFGRGRGTERKRWSICGGERRADLDLETIWED